MRYLQQIIESNVVFIKVYFDEVERVQAINEEMKIIKKNQTWELVEKLTLS